MGRADRTRGPPAPNSDNSYIDSYDRRSSERRDPRGAHRRTLHSVKRADWAATAVSWLAVAAAAGMFVVLVMGATVTTTGSAEGCGRDWPLCHGRFIPEFALATAIEFSHRAVTGVEGILVVALTAAGLALYRDHRPVPVLAPLMPGFLLLPAGMGPWARRRSRPTWPTAWGPASPCWSRWGCWSPAAAPSRGGATWPRERGRWSPRWSPRAPPARSSCCPAGA